jgi:hypothetical protein
LRAKAVYLIERLEERINLVVAPLLAIAILIWRRSERLAPDADPRGR